MAEITPPSARPAIRLVAVPITRPMSFMPCAPVSAIISFTAACRLLALLSQLGEQLQGVGVVKIVVRPGCGLCLEKHFFDIAQGFKTHLVTGLHGLFDVVAYLFE